MALNPGPIVSYHGASVNDGIPKDQFSLRYLSVGSGIQKLVELGPGALMAKFDVEAAYRYVAIHALDHPLLGIVWRGRFFIDLVLPFGQTARYVFPSSRPSST